MKAFKTIKKNQYRQYTFKMLMKHIRKGEKSSLQRLQIKVFPLKVKNGLIYALHREHLITPSSF